MALKIPDDRRYSRDHQWVVASGENFRVGITDYAQDALGEVVFVELPRLDQSLSAGETCGEIESSKSVSDIYSPLPGKVVRINEMLPERPGQVNSDPYGDGWIFEVRIDDNQRLDGLLDAKSYRRLIEG